MTESTNGIGTTVHTEAQMWVARIRQGEFQRFATIEKMLQNYYGDALTPAMQSDIIRTVSLLLSSGGDLGSTRD